MKTITAVGIDVAKNIFQVYGCNQAEKMVTNKKVKRKQLIDHISQMPEGCLIFMEACGGSHYWAREFQNLGFEVKLIAGHHVKKFVTGNKNDAIDAAAIVTCGLRPNTRFVPIKSEEQLEGQAIHRIRSRLSREMTSLCNEMRSFLYEHGYTFPQGRKKLISSVKELIKLTSEELRPGLKGTISELFNEYLEKEERLKEYEKKINDSFSEDPRKEMLLKVAGVGPITASAILTEVGNPNYFKNGKHFAAFLGLVPRHSGSGGRNINFSISKRGDTYIRTLLIHGSRSILRFTSKKNDSLSCWAESLKGRMHANKVSVALANKNARIIWKILASGVEYDPNHIQVKSV